MNISNEYLMNGLVAQTSDASSKKKCKHDESQKHLQRRGNTGTETQIPPPLSL